MEETVPRMLALTLHTRALLLALAVLAPAVATVTQSDHAAADAFSPLSRTVPSHIRQPPGFLAPAPRLSAPSGANEFPGMGPCLGGVCFAPGEPVIAVGPNDVLETVNAAATVYSKAGTNRAEFDFSSFWGGETTYCVDPRTLYIASADRFAISCTDITKPTSPMRFAISATSDPAGAWHLYAAPNTSFLDQDKIVASSDKFIIAGNTGSTEQMYVYSLADVLAGLAKPSVVSLTAKKSNVYQAAVEQTATSNGYLVSSHPGGGLYLATVTGTPSAGNVALQETTISSKDFPAPLEPQVPGGSIGGGDLDGRIYDAVYETETSDSKPVIAYSSSRECGNRTCITSARIDLSGTKPVLSSNALVGEPGWDYTYGAVGLNASGSAFEAYSRSSASADPGVGVIGPGFDVSLQAAASETSTCFEAAPPCNERWGDYLGTAIDPSEPSSVWVSGLYQASNGPYGWATVIAKVSASSFALPTATTGGASSVTATSAQVAGTVNPNGVATTYHVDYGLTSGYEAATTQQSAGSGSSPVPVSAALSALSPGTTYHYRVLASTTAGNAVGADKTFKTKAPKVTSVTFTGTPSNPTITINGSNFGTQPAPNPSTPLNCVPGDTSFDYGTSLLFNDSTRGWTAGQTGDCIGLVVSSYTSTKIVYQFGADYANFGQVTAGDAYKLTLWTATHKGTVAYS
jgi:hypothetical protein